MKKLNGSTISSVERKWTFHLSYLCKNSYSPEGKGPKSVPQSPPMLLLTGPTTHGERSSLPTQK